MFVPHVFLRVEVPLYSYDGALIGWITQQRVNRLEGLGLARVVRHKKGTVNRVVMHRRNGDPKPTKLTDYLGTRYSFREHLDDGHICWKLRRYPLLELLDGLAAPMALGLVPRQRGGSMFPSLLTVYSLFRFLEEWIRGDVGGLHFGPLSFAQGVSLLIATCAFLVLLRRNRRVASVVQTF